MECLLLGHDDNQKQRLAAMTMVLNCNYNFVPQSSITVVARF